MTFQKSKSKVIQSLRVEISKTYMQIVTNNGFKLQNDVLDSLLCIITYIIHYVFFDYFPKDRKHFTSRFILNCYHITFLEINGVQLSDFYVKKLFEKAFTLNFMSYSTAQYKRQELIKKQKEKNTKKVVLVKHLRPKVLVTSKLAFVYKGKHLWNRLDKKFNVTSKFVKKKYIPGYLANKDEKITLKGS